MGKHKSQRLGVTVQLVPGQDDDLISWVQALSNNRNQVVKDTLRMALGLPVPIHQEVVQVAELNDLRTRIEHLQLDAAQAAELSDLRAQVEYLQSWITKVTDELPGFVHSEVERHSSNGAAAQSGAPMAGMVSDPDEIRPEEIQERRAKLKRATW